MFKFFYGNINIMNNISINKVTRVPINSLDIGNEAHHYRGLQPGISSLLVGPVYSFQMMPHFTRAINARDFSESARLFLCLYNFLGATCYGLFDAANYVTTPMQVFNIYLPFGTFIGSIIPVFGTIVATLCSIMGSIELFRSFRLRMLVTPVDKTSPQEVLNTLKKVQEKYLAVSEKEGDKIWEKCRTRHPDASEEQLKTLVESELRKDLEMRYTRLTSRVGVKCADKVLEKLPNLIEKLQEDDQGALGEANELLGTLKTQCSKKMLFQGVVLVLLGLMVTSFILTPIGLPWVLVGITVSTTAIALLNTTYRVGFIDEEGWFTFKASNFIPVGLQNLLSRINGIPITIE